MAQFSTFYLDDRIFGLDILSIQEITHLQDITPVPDAPYFVEGLANLRGQIVVAVNLRKIFSLPPRAGSKNPIHIVLHSEGEVISLMADRAGDVVDFGYESLVPPPDLSKHPSPGLIRGVFQLERSLLNILNVDAIFAPEADPDFQPLNHAK
jgi:purine-binding chemotaxis protein CheW